MNQSLSVEWRSFSSPLLRIWTSWLFEYCDWEVYGAEWTFRIHTYSRCELVWLVVRFRYCWAKFRLFPLVSAALCWMRLSDTDVVSQCRGNLSDVCLVTSRFEDNGVSRWVLRNLTKMCNCDYCKQYCDMWLQLWYFKWWYHESSLLGCQGQHRE